MTYTCNDDLAALLTNLRAAQKAFFAAQHGSFEKQQALYKSKMHEHELDKFLKARKEAAEKVPDLFS